MSRKDTIIIAVFINAGLLVMLFVSALKPPTQTSATSQENLVVSYPKSAPPTPAPALSSTGQDQWDRVLAELSKENKTTQQQAAVVTHTEAAPKQAVATPVVEVPPKKIVSIPVDNKIVVVKQGDVLEKIAKTHGVTVQDLMKVNQMTDARLQIGQVLQLPLKEPKKEVAKPAVSLPPQAVFYVVKQGDNLWKIAIENHLKVEELLKLNHLDEKKAKSLKPGDQLRIK